MRPIALWLNGLGLGQYAQRFADNDIDASILRDLTNEDLEKIGVSLGHRKRMLRAIAELDEAPCALGSCKLGVPIVLQRRLALGRWLPMAIAIRVRQMRQDQLPAGRTIRRSDSGLQASARCLCCHKESAVACRLWNLPERSSMQR